MKFTKIIALILCAIICISSFSACLSSDSDGKDEETTTPQKENNHAKAQDYNNEEFTFLKIRQKSNGIDYYGGNWLDADSNSGNTIEEAVYKRNLDTEKKYNVQITEIIEDDAEPADIIRSYDLADDFCFDVIYGWGYKLYSFIPMGYFSDASSLPNTNMTENYWSPKTLDELSVSGKLYVFTNDITMNKLGWSNVIFFNPKIADDYSVYENIGNFYELVKNGKWTLDKYLEAVISVQTDVDGNNVINTNDIYGLIDGGAIGDTLGISCGVDLVTKNSDSSLLLSFFSEKTQEIAEKVYDVYSTDHVMNYSELTMGADILDGMDIYQYSRSFFTKGHSLFMSGGLQLCYELRDMEEYGILPLPKYDENQESYITPVEATASMFALPVRNRTDVKTASPERTGTILEYMASRSEKKVMPVYLESIVPARYYDKDNILNMIDFIKDSASYDIGYMLAMSTDIYLTNISGIYTHTFHSPEKAITTYIGKYKFMQTALDEFYSDILTLEE